MNVILYLCQLFVNCKAGRQMQRNNEKAQCIDKSIIKMDDKKL